jgi:hypothetical protein
VWLSACGAQSSPSPIDIGPSPTHYAISGQVSFVPARASDGAAMVEVADGVNVGVLTATTSDGRYRIERLLPGDMTLVASADGFDSKTRRVTLTADLIVDFSLQATSSSGPAPPTPSVTAGRFVDALTRTGLRGVAFAGLGVSGAPADAAGAFQIRTTDSVPTPRRLVFTGATVVERRTTVRLPGANLLVSLIAAGFDLAAFDQMFRTPGLTRWTSAPPLLIERRVVQFTDVNMPEGAALDDQLSPAETDSVLADLSGALSPMTGGTFGGFASVRIVTSAAGSVVGLLNDGVMTVTWVAGLQAATGFTGYGRWRSDGDGTVTAGLVMLDSDFQRSGSPFVRLLRVHELGHGLGYGHVTATLSVMHPSARFELSEFDHEATRIAFDRQPGNRSPDVDPDTVTTNRLNGAGQRWSAPRP